MTWSLTDIGNGYFIPTVMRSTETGIEILQYRVAYYVSSNARTQLRRLQEEEFVPSDWHELEC